MDRKKIEKLIHRANVARFLGNDATADRMICAASGDDALSFFGDTALDDAAAEAALEIAKRRKGGGR